MHRDLHICCSLSPSNCFSACPVCLSMCLPVFFTIGIWDCLDVAFFKVTALRLSSTHHRKFLFLCMFLFNMFPKLFFCCFHEDIFLACLDSAQHSAVFSPSLVMCMYTFLPVSSSSNIYFAVSFSSVLPSFLNRSYNPSQGSSVG